MSKHGGGNHYYCCFKWVNSSCQMNFCTSLQSIKALTAKCHSTPERSTVYRTSSKQNWVCRVVLLTQLTPHCKNSTAETSSSFICSALIQKDQLFSKTKVEKYEGQTHRKSFWPKLEENFPKSVKHPEESHSEPNEVLNETTNFTSAYSHTNMEAGMK